MAEPDMFSATTTGPETEYIKPYSDSFSTSEVIFNLETLELTVSIFKKFPKIRNKININ